MQVCTSLHTDNHTSTPPLSCYRPDALFYRPTNSVRALKVHPRLHSTDKVRPCASPPQADSPGESTDTVSPCASPPQADSPGESTDKVPPCASPRQSDSPGEVPTRSGHAPARLPALHHRQVYHPDRPSPARLHCHAHSAPVMLYASEVPRATPRPRTLSLEISRYRNCGLHRSMPRPNF